MFELKGKVVLVTGGASGIGLCCVEEFLKNGVKGVTIVDLNETTGFAVVQELKKEFGEKVMFVKADVTNKSQLTEAFQKTVTDFHYLDVVVNSAGILNDQQWELEVDINIKGTIHGNLLAFKYLKEYRQGTDGVILNIGSIAGISVNGFLPIYNTTKHAIVGLSRSFGLAVHYNRTNIRVICVCPGPTNTDLVNYGVGELLDDEYLGLLIEAKGKMQRQKPGLVGEGVIKVISTGNSGSVWIIENSEAPYEVDIPFYRDMKKK